MHENKSETSADLSGPALDSTENGADAAPPPEEPLPVVPEPAVDGGADEQNGAVSSGSSPAPNDGGTPKDEPEEGEAQEEPAKSSSELLEELFGAFLGDKEKKKKSKHKKEKKEKHKKKKKHKEKKHKSKKSADFYEKADVVDVAPDGAKFDVQKCDLYAPGELDSEEEKALSFDCFVEKPEDEQEKSKKRSAEDEPEGSSKKPKIEIGDLKKCSVSKLVTGDKKKKYEDGELSSSSNEDPKKQRRKDDKDKRSSRSASDKRRAESPRSKRLHTRRSRSRERRHDSRRSRSRDRGERRSKERHERDRASARDRNRRPERRSREEERIDKKKLLAIAKKNATYLLKEQQERMLQAGVLPAASVSSKAGKSVAELTEYCKKLVNSGSGTSDSESDSELSQGDGPTESFIHHPFTLRDRPNSIVMNIRNSTQLPTKSMQEKAAESCKMRSLQYPVSSGQQHRSTEWVPVSPGLKALPAPEPSESAPKPKPSATVSAITASCTDNAGMVDISSVISQKLSAMRKLQESGLSSISVGSSYGYASGPISALSGTFTGSTGVKPLTPAELASGQQAWARKDQLKTAAPVAGGMGMKLLQKMGWKPGEGLGKNKEGGLEPLNLDVKMDKKGLVAPEECRTRFQPFSGAAKKKEGGGGGGAAAPPAGGHEVFSGKHPVSALVELCTKRRWGSPAFELVFESGPDHKKNFLFKVKVNGREYQDQIAHGNKKQAKAMAAQHCLLQLGLAIKM